MIALAIALVPWAAFQEQEEVEPEDPVQVLEELIERTNELTAFRAVYHLTKPDRKEENSILELSFSDSYGMRMVMHSAASDERVASWVVVEEKLCTVMSGPEEDLYTLVDLAAPEHLAYEILEAHFPRASEAPLGPGLTFRLSWRVHPETDEMDLEFSLGWAPVARTTMLDWLIALKKEPDLLSLEEDAIVQRHPSWRATVSRDTGFLTEVISLATQGTMRLEELDLDPELDASLFAIPTRPEEARDVSQESADRFRYLEKWQFVRPTCLRRIDRQLEEGRVEWDSRTREHCKEVLRALHEPTLQEKGAEYAVEMEDYLEGLCDEITERKAAGEPLAALRAEVESRREELERSIESGLPKWLARLEESELEAGESSHWSDLLEMEMLVVEELFEELMAAPALSSFDSATEEALDG